MYQRRDNEHSDSRSKPPDPGGTARASSASASNADRSAYFDASSGPSAASSSTGNAGDQTVMPAHPGNGLPADPFTSFLAQGAAHSSFAVPPPAENEPDAIELEDSPTFRLRHAEDMKHRVAELVMRYTKQFDVFDVKDYGDLLSVGEDGDKSTESISGTLAQRVDIIRSFRLRSKHLVQVASVGIAPYCFTVDLVGFFEHTTWKLVEIMEEAAAILPWCKEIDVSWHPQFEFALNNTYSTTGVAIRAFRHLRDTILNAAERTEIALRLLPEDAPITPIPPINGGVVTPYRASTPSDRTARQTPANGSKSVAASVRALTAKDLEAFRKLNASPPSSENFYTRPSRQKEMRRTSFAPGVETIAPLIDDGLTISGDDDQDGKQEDDWDQDDPEQTRFNLAPDTTHFFGDDVTTAMAAPPTFIPGGLPTDAATGSRAEVSHQLHVQQPTPGGPFDSVPPSGWTSYQYRTPAGRSHVSCHSHRSTLADRSLYLLFTPLF
ncbi:hypothetical protein EXIGLDRAFT_778846 [Exidia glandulosa HHB12029]|uniref:Uncharacterized protein n=1 Tax=Exidia glandulosa HHB12029 TaxID=1314781 RepID=A0A165CCL6_EXIGL|nr:hypothetical protein EXIGLDRAFT_778846 [Exidia glandulosa HHB12029]